MRRAAAVGVLTLILAVTGTPANAQQDDCPRAVVFALPGVTWADVARVRPPNILAAADDGAVGSMAVRTVSPRTSYASGFATIGAGTRVEAGRTTGTIVRATETDGGLFQRDVVVGGLAEMKTLVEESTYDAKPGALGETFLSEVGGYTVAIGNSDPGLDPAVPLGPGRWAPLATMATDGTAQLAVVSEILLETADGYPFGVRTSPETAAETISSALSIDACTLVVIDPGDLTRADELATIRGAALPEWSDRALMAADGLLAATRSSLTDDDLLLIVSPTSPGWDPEVHLGVAIATGRGFPAGSSLSSGSTRADHLVTLPDVAPTVLAHFGVDPPSEMLGRRFRAEPTDQDDRVAAMVELDDESVYSHGIQADIATGFVLVQLVVLALVVILLRRESGEQRYLDGHPLVRRCLEWGALAFVAFPIAAYLSTPLPAHELTLVWLVPVIVAIDLLVVAVASLLIGEPLDRLMAIALATVALIVVDLALGGRLQFNSVFGNDPIVAGRFAGLGNIGFAILGVATLLAAALIAHRFGGRPWVTPVILALFAITVVADGAPQLGSDVGGVLALVPAMAITWLLVTGKRPGWRVLLLGLVGGLVVLGVFLAIDLARPVDEQTHLGRFYSDIRDRGLSVFFDTVERKARTNLRVFRSTIYTYLVPPALAVIAYLLFRPTGSWQRFADEFPKLRAGLIGGLALAILGFLVNDSGIVVPAMILSFLVPLSLLTHLRMGRTT